MFEGGWFHVCEECHDRRIPAVGYGGESMAHMRYLAGRTRPTRKAAEDRQAFRPSPTLSRCMPPTISLSSTGTWPMHVSPPERCSDEGNRREPRRAIAGEEHEVDQMYPVYYEAAKFQGRRMPCAHSTSPSRPRTARRILQAGQGARPCQKDMEFEAMLICPCAATPWPTRRRKSAGVRCAEGTNSPVLTEAEEGAVPLPPFLFLGRKPWDF